MSGSSEAKLIYFHLSVKFFHEYKWIYDFKATRILEDSVMQSIPLNFQEYFKSLEDTSEKFRELLILKDHDDWPPGISKFVRDCIHLKNLSERFQSSFESETSTDALISSSKSKLKLPKKWNPKKYFEVIHVGNFVGEKCKAEKCDAVIDIGAGLGYLSRHIASQFQLPVIGIESDASRVKTATNEFVTTNSADSSVSQHKYVCLKVTENISEEINPYAEKYKDVCVTALHACGDLTPWSLRHFARTDTCRMLAVVPCCYHKMSLKAANFPMSSCLNSALQNYEDTTFLKNQWLWRLASQRSGNKFLNDINKETENLFFRAILEKICTSENLLLKRRKRNLHDSNHETFCEYLEQTFGANGGFDLFREDCKIDEPELGEMRRLMLLQYNQLKSWSQIITGIVALQGAIQKIAEDMVLIDRLTYIEEQENIKEAGLVKVIPDDVSPRGMGYFVVLMNVFAKKIYSIGFFFNITRNFSNKSQLRDLLIKMPKETAHVPILKEVRKVKKENLVKYPAGIIILQVLGNGAKGAPRSLYVFTDQTRYLFNCGEGTQRLAHEHKMKLAKLEHMFITNNSWDSTGGLPGVALTIQDIGVPEITLHGPPRIEKLFEGTRRFVVLKDLKIKVANMSSEGFEDHILQIDYVKLLPSVTGELADKGSSSEESVIEEDDTDYYAPIKGCKRHLEITKDSEEEKTKRTKVDEDEGTSDTVMCYICRPRKKEGTLLIEKCVEMGVPAGPLLGKLKAGNNVTLPNGNVVKAEDVRSPDCPGPVFIIVDCPEESYLESLISNSKLMTYHNPKNTEDFPHIIVHFTPSRVLLNPKYKAWMEKFPHSSKHLMLNDSCTGMGSEAVHRIQHKLSLLDDKMFPALNEKGVELFYPSSAESNINQYDVNQKPEILKEFQVPIVMGSTLLKYNLRPTTELDCVSSLVINKDENIREVLQVENFSSVLENMKSKVNSLKCDDADIYPEFLFLGTGSCIPNKTRNTSAILVHTDPSSCILMDCGEGTYGQLVRFFGNENVDEVLCKVKAIYISHLHADHHIGLVQVIRKRYAALKERNIPPSPVYLLAPHQIQTWLHLYNKFFEKIKNAYQLIPNIELRLNLDAAQDSVFASEVKQLLGLQQIQTTFVRHCPNAFGVAFTHSSGWKITYSGDTMPCDSLVEIGKDSDVLIHEATMEDDLEQEAVLKMHSTTSQAIEIGNQMNAKFILLTHFSQRYAKVPKINENFGSNVGIAFDNMKVRKCDLPKIPLMYDALNAMFNEDVEEMEQKTIRRLKRKELESMNLKQATR